MKNGGLALEESLKDHVTLTHRTGQIIERAILNGSMKNGERIVETELAKRLGISKAPVREALKKLEGDGIVELLPRKGYIVKPITLKSVSDFFEIMFLLEPEAAKLSLRERTDSVCEEFDGLVMKMKDALKSEDYELYTALNDQFHSLFYRLTQNEWIAKINQMLRKQARILRSLSLYTKDRVSSSIEEHVSIAGAYEKGNAKLLSRLVRFHLEMFKKNILESDFLKP
jgi:DNA-binding GntR family transcriptional regulator